VERDGSKRLLRGYRDASWSPHGLYVAAVRGDELRALEPDGAVHWSLARPGGLASPRWSDATPPCCRIAYLAGNTLRVVNGDGTDDRVVASHVRAVAPAWQPRAHVLAYVDADGSVRVVETDSGRRLEILRPAEPARGLEWSSEGKLLLVRGARSIELFGPEGTHLQPLERGAAPVVVATLSPNGRSVAFVQQATTRDGTRSFLWRFARLAPDETQADRVFAGAGAFSDVEWSPDGRWLLLNWPSADQWLFIRSAAVRKVDAVSNITASFGPHTHLQGWCCA
jgi:WD40 repeat protein